MPATVMQVSHVLKHPNADSLFIYQMISKDNIKTQVVANSENLYEVNDLTIVATVGSKLKDGTYIGEQKVRGVVSSGMALGKTIAPIGTDFTEEYCQPVFHVNWPDITSLFNIRKYMQETNAVKDVHYAAKIKLDGTCGAIQILPNGDIIVQSREKIITPDDDNKGFARWAEENKAYLKPLAQENPIIVFGEWCGQGISKRCSISKIDKKIFAVFAIQHPNNVFDVNPLTIRSLLPYHSQVHVIPFYDFIDVDYTNVEELEKQVAVMNEWVAKVEECDPFVKDVFNIEGLGEGLVMYPIPKNFDKLKPVFIQREEFQDLVFKCKGEKHQVVKVKQPVQIDPEIAANVNEFADLFTTENRLDQIAGKVGTIDMKNTSNFIKAFCNDVEKESKAELEVSGLVWNEKGNPLSVCKAISDRARDWWINEVKTRAME